MFTDKRELLLKDALKFKSKSDVKSEFRREFLSLVEKVIIDMLGSEDNFFGQFLIKVKRDIRLDITWPIATIPKIDGFNMYFNPILFLNCDKKEMVALLKHEIYHIMYGHFEREKNLKNKCTVLAVNLALDISVNQFIKNLPSNSYKIDRINREYELSLKGDRPCEVYAEKIDEGIKRKTKLTMENSDDNGIARIIDISKAHDLWAEGNLNEDAIKEMTRKTAISSLKGDAPKDIKDMIGKYTEKAEISWQETLKKLIPSLKSGQKKTITRLSRRQPNRLDLRGTLPNKVPEIIVAIDISASINDDEIHKIMVEVLEITKNRKNNITVIECDNEIRRVYKIKSRNDIKKRLTNTGSTKFSPVFKYIKNNNLRNHVLIYFTDGVGENDLEIRPINISTIWVIIGDEKFTLNKTYGQVKRINSNKIKGEGGNTGLNMYRELQHDWAR